MSEYTEYYAIHAPSLDELKATLLASNIRAQLLPYLSMDGVNMDGLTGFAKVTGIPLHILTNQTMMDFDACIPEGRTVIFLDDFLD